MTDRTKTICPPIFDFGVIDKKEIFYYYLHSIKKRNYLIDDLNDNMEQI